MYVRVDFSFVLARRSKGANWATANCAAYFEELGPIFNLLLAFLLYDLVRDPLIHQSKLLIRVICRILHLSLHSTLLTIDCLLFASFTASSRIIVLENNLRVFNFNRRNLLVVTVFWKLRDLLFLLFLIPDLFVIGWLSNRTLISLSLDRGRSWLGFYKTRFSLNLTLIGIFTGDLTAFLSFRIKNRFAIVLSVCNLRR